MCLREVVVGATFGDTKKTIVTAIECKSRCAINSNNYPTRNEFTEAVFAPFQHELRRYRNLADENACNTPHLSRSQETTPQTNVPGLLPSTH
jgi:hypothetical protein